MKSLTRTVRAIPFLLLLSAGIVHADDHSLYDGHVTVTLPEGWTVAKSSEEPGRRRA